MGLTDEQVKEMLSDLSEDDMKALAGLLSQPAAPKQPAVQTKPRDGAYHKGQHYTCKWQYWTIEVPHHYTCQLCGSVTHINYNVDVLSKTQPDPANYEVSDKLEWCSFCHQTLTNIDHRCLVDLIINQAKLRQRGAISQKTITPVEENNETE